MSKLTPEQEEVKLLLEAATITMESFQSILMNQNKRIDKLEAEVAEIQQMSKIKELLTGHFPKES